MSILRRAFGFALVVTALASVAHATSPTFAPEIDPGTASSALTLITGALMIFKSRARAK